MITRACDGIVKTLTKMNLSASHTLISSIPRNYYNTLADPNWRATMADEFQALVNNGTWRLVPRSPGANVMTGKWIYKHKFHSDDTLPRHKARWVARGYSQQYDINCNDTFNSVVKPSTIRVVLSITASSACPIRQLDMKNAFLHGHLEEIIYC
ncbi:uncharacterized mitochondrial protein AtMg00820-like [Phragmites australis]|uniref:uncharacterized mitochondrial protein AtMg00820-like n=1 Tax=Phragmites australis TaxID=29695 RepID=UPI002D785711|nr:uncharacterized mitochondrial protein AtMg00820-like [Phragmites australis]